ncbi:DoxX family membrane protein [Xylanimonas allomyrinae]|uniref:DoxX family membrane protein n=1 Tax=Xylanimonas allomyrinae TaxID=2509459 RepID=A0A4P6ENK0_9MICO|nr:DoxX family membrane protein [Xylanimonas allomyrinae]QAY63303.1 DoxX family membrane protein [Xylanimonas allomyrinae]
MLLRRVARPLLAAPFVYDGVQAALHPDEHVEAARGLADQATDRLGVARLTDAHLTLAVRAHGGLTAVLGVALGAGFLPRLASLKLAALALPLAVVHQPFTAKGPERAEKTAKFVRALGAVGGALLAGLDTEGKPGLSWRVSNARRLKAQKAHKAHPAA